MAFSDKDKFVEMDKIGATWLDRGAEAYRQGTMNWPCSAIKRQLTTAIPRLCAI